ncbi:tRNA epoxyqueuosine(34) reductase QueG [Granulicella cerasi]|uniref:tRNA epoxyqueuosine(34) reductase QueG n=1 Tax=Granulicella cerasi TaxID=741063 RepID=A0ABW1Z8I0_9BACT|nr:tRNA epoxyqueuosine(34) reductase QueG [Granulicella cerasi]
MSAALPQDELKLDAEARAWVEAAAKLAGFDAVGLAPVVDESLTDDRFAAWIAAGNAGEMEWLKRVDAEGRLVRGDLRRSIPWARTVLVCAKSYNAAEPKSLEPAAQTQGWIARYAWSGEASAAMGEPGRGTDYHDTLLERLREVERALHERWPAVQTRCYVDTGPLLERDFAAKAGIGWIGKNTCVLHQGLGSFMLLSVIVLSMPLAAEAVLSVAADRCGTCTRCIDACPTDALRLPTAEEPARSMDATRCIAYLTIEKKGSIAEEMRPLIGRQVFGCDICQDVCPWNRKAMVVESLPIRRELVNPELEWMAAMDGREFNRWFRGSPLERTRRKRVQRNVAIAMGNSGEAQFAERLREWTQDEDVALAESASWALQQIEVNAMTRGDEAASEK